MHTQQLFRRLRCLLSIIWTPGRGSHRSPPMCLFLFAAARSLCYKDVFTSTLHGTIASHIGRVTTPAPAPASVTTPHTALMREHGTENTRKKRGHRWHKRVLGLSGRPQPGKCCEEEEKIAVRKPKTLSQKAQDKPNISEEKDQTEESQAQHILKQA